MVKNKMLDIENIKQKSNYIFKKNNFVKRAYLFGSYAKQTATEKSDIDFLIETDRDVGLEFFGLYDYLQEEFQKNVDVITQNEAERIMGNKINRERVLIYER